MCPISKKEVKDAEITTRIASVNMELLHEHRVVS
jgi:hypothetical protein